MADQVDVPSAVVDDKGRVWLYSVTWAKAVRNRIVVAIGRGNDWVYKRVNVERLERGWAVPVDPTVVRMPDGSYRMYYFTGIPGSSAETKDGASHRRRR